MAGSAPPSSGHHGDDPCTSDDASVKAGDESMDPELLRDLNRQPLLSSSSSWSQDGDRLRGGPLDRKWTLWHEFMQEHAHLDAWLLLGEQAAAHVTYGASREELRKFERLRCEAGAQLIRLDSLTRANRSLARLFDGAMQARLLASARESARRWDDVNAKLGTITGRLQLLVSEWEEFEAEREELALWLADMDARLTEIDHMTANNCEKLRRLQSFQQSVCENSGRINELLRRGEELIQHSEAADAQHIESRLLELLRRCSHVYNGIARTHTRLLSTRLVFDDDWLLSRATDSGFLSESVNDDGVSPKCDLDLPSAPPRLRDFRRSVNAAPTRLPHRPSTPPPAFFPTHEHLGLEWDPSVDVGRSVSHDDADSSYFSACTGVGQRDDTKRWSYLSFDSCSDISADITNQEAALEWTDQTEPEDDQWAASTPKGGVIQPMRFDGGRVKAWLRVQGSAPPEDTTSCSRAVQTEYSGDVFSPEMPSQWRLRPDSWCCHDDAASPQDWPPHLRDATAQDEDERRRCEDEEPSSRRSSSSSALLFLLLAAALALLAVLTWVAMEPPCYRSNRLQRSLHLTLSYVNGPPPT